MHGHDQGRGALLPVGGVVMVCLDGPLAQPLPSNNGRHHRSPQAQLHLLERILTDNLTESEKQTTQGCRRVKAQGLRLKVGEDRSRSASA